MSKPPAKTAADRKTAATTAAGGSAAKPAPAAKAPAKAATAAAKPVPSKTAPAAKPAAAPKVAAPKAVAPVAAPAPAAAPKAAAKTPVKAAPVPAPVPPAAPVSNRFTDRFAPAKPSPRPEHLPMEAVKPAVKADPKLANAWKTKAGRDLTEAELLAMPESEYMNDKQLDFFRSQLQQQKDDLLSNAGETTEHLREDTTIVPDPADRATIEEEHALELRTRDRERKQKMFGD